MIQLTLPAPIYFSILCRAFLLYTYMAMQNDLAVGEDNTMKQISRLTILSLILLIFLNACAVRNTQEEPMIIQVAYLSDPYYYVLEGYDAGIITFVDGPEAPKPGGVYAMEIDGGVREIYPPEATVSTWKDEGKQIGVLKTDFNFNLSLIEPTHLIDVRTPEEYAAGHVPNSINIPVDRLGEEMPHKIPDQDAIVLLYCASGNRSSQAAKMLIDLGYRIVFDLGGINSYTGTTVKS